MPERTRTVLRRVGRIVLQIAGKGPDEEGVVRLWDAVGKVCNSDVTRQEVEGAVHGHVV